MKFYVLGTLDFESSDTFNFTVTGILNILRKLFCVVLYQNIGVLGIKR